MRLWSQSHARPPFFRPIAVLISMVIAGPVTAQDSDGSSIEMLDAVATTRLTELGSFGGTFDGALIADDSGVAIEVGEEKEVATFRLSWAHLRHRAALTISSPVEKDLGRADFVGFGGVNQAATAKLDYTRVHWPRVDFSTGTDIHDPSSEDERKIRELTTCSLALWLLREHAPSLMRQGRLDSELEAAYDKVKGKDLLTIAPSIREFIKLGIGVDNLPAEEKRQFETPALLETICKDDLYIRLSPFLAETPVQTPRQAAQGERVFFWNLQGQVGNKKFDHFDTADLSEETTRETPTGFGLSIGWVFLSKKLGSLDNSVALTYRRENGFEAAKTADHCTELAEPEPESGRLERCKTLPFGPPIDSEADFFGLEYRHLKERIGTGVRAFYRGQSAKEDEFGLEVPLYFLPTKKAKLAGGVRFAWSDQNKEEITVFVGKTFEPLLGKVP